MADRPGSVLCVDDEPNISRALQWLLQKDFEVKTANSGQDGLALVGQNDFDVVISDQRMPGMTGVEFLREVRRVSPRSMRILLTGYSDLQAVLRSVNESEVYRFINKPWNIAELPKVVEQAVVIARTQPVEPPAPELTEDSPLLAAADDVVLLIDDHRDMLKVVQGVVGSAVKVIQASDLAEAISILNEQPVSVIVSETRVGSIDATRLIRLMKQKYPDVVSVVMSGQADTEMVTSLINQGQIFRFVPKPIRIGYLKLVINTALVKHRRMVETPLLAGRHRVEPSAAGSLEALVADVEKLAKEADRRGDTPAPEAVAGGGGLFGRLSNGLRRLFGN